MGMAMPNETPEIASVMERIRHGNTAAVAELFEHFRPPLYRMVKLRMDRRLQKRLDCADVLQEVFIDVSRRIGEYVANPTASVYVWMRFLTGQKLAELHRHHLGTQMRTPDLEVSLYRRAMPEATSMSLAAQLLGTVTAPLKAVVRAEAQLKLQEALNGMDSMDREILILRHFEEMGNNQIAEMLEISPSAATMRYMRALQKLSRIMKSIPGLHDPSTGGS